MFLNLPYPRLFINEKPNFFNDQDVFSKENVIYMTSSRPSLMDFDDYFKKNFPNEHDSLAKMKTRTGGGTTYIPWNLLMTEVSNCIWSGDIHNDRY